MTDEKPPVVAVFNSNDDLVEVLRTAFELAGLVVVSAHLDEIRRGRTSLIEFAKEHDPAVIVYDITPPYDRSYRFFQHMCALDGLSTRRFVLTSTNPARAMEAAHPGDVIHEIVGKPYDLDRLTGVVRAAAGIDSPLTRPPGASDEAVANAEADSSGRRVAGAESGFYPEPEGTERSRGGGGYCP